jgi:hypothetical protein
LSVLGAEVGFVCWLCSEKHRGHVLLTAESQQSLPPHCMCEPRDDEVIPPRLWPSEIRRDFGSDLI